GFTDRAATLATRGRRGGGSRRKCRRLLRPRPRRILIDNLGANSIADCMKADHTRAMPGNRQTISFKIADPDRDAHAILAALRGYGQRTGYLPRLERIGGMIYLRAPEDVFAEWLLAFGRGLKAKRR